MIQRRLPLVLLLTASLAAQATENRFIPADAQLVARVAAPAKWKKDFAATKIAKVFAGQALAPMLAMFEQGFDSGVEQMKADGMDADLLDGLFRDYEGDIVVGLRLDLDDLAAAIDEDRPPALAMTWTLTPDGEYDLAAFCAALGRVAEDKHGDDLRDVVVGEHTLRVDTSSDVQVVAPTMIDGQLVMMFATDVERDAPRMLADDDRHTSIGAGKSLLLHVDVDRAITKLIDVAQAKMEEDPDAPPIDLVQVLTDIGLGCLRSVDVTVATDGDQTVLETDLRSTGQDLGLLGTFMLDHGPLQSLRYVPASAPAFACQPFHLGAVYTTVKKVWSAFDGLVPMSFDDLEEAFAESTKVRLDEDLLAHLGTELLYTSDPDDEETEDDPSGLAAMFGSSCYALTLRDGRAFGESLEKALRSRGLHAARKSEDYQGVTVYSLRVAGAVKIEYAVTDDLLLVAPGSDSSGRQLRAILDARANPETGLPERIAGQTEGVPRGWNGVSITPMASLLGQLGRILEATPANEAPPEVQMLGGIFQAVGPEMKQLGLDEAVQFSWTSSTGIRTVTRL